MRNYEGTTRLQGLGIREGIKAKNLKVGDVLVWNFGGTSTVKEITFSKTGKTLVIVEEFKGQDYTRRLGAERIVVVKELNPVEEVQAVEEVKEVKEVKEDKAVEEVEAVVENATVYNLDLPLGKRLKAVHELGLKKGDVVTMEFTDGQRVTIQVERVGFMRRQTTGNKMIDRFYIEDNCGYPWNLYTTKTIRIDYRNPKSKKVLTRDLKQFHDYMEYVLADEKVKKYREDRKKREEEAEALRDKLAKEINEIVEKNKAELEEVQAVERDYQPTNKEVVIKELEAEGLVLGCWSDKIGNLSKHNLKKITDEIRYHSATDVVVRLRGKECVVSIDFVDNEVDFTLYSKAEYISRYGSEKFEE